MSLCIRRKTRRFESRHSFVLDPAKLSVTPSQPVLHIEGLSLVECSLISVQTCFQIVRMNAFRPAVAKLRFQLPASEVQSLLVEVVAELIRARTSKSSQAPYLQPDGSALRSREAPVPIAFDR